MKLFWIILCITLLTGCADATQSGVNAAGNLKLLMFECWGYCRVSDGETDGAVDVSHESERTLTP